MKKAIIQTTNAPSAIGPYSQAVKAGDLLFLSGQIPTDAAGTVVTGGIEVSTHQVMKNILAILEKAGLSMSHIVKTTIFLKDMNDFAKVNTVYASYFTGNYPARETVQVARLPKDVEVEISIIAHAGE
jgi:2-iminobutanoate/2-iminopropanoate deaminase